MTPEQIESLLNWDGLHCKPPFRNAAEECQHYARYIDRMLWRYLTPKDWRRLAEVIDSVRVDDKLKRATQFLIKRHLSQVAIPRHCEPP
jgi:hypothetical protein